MCNINLQKGTNDFYGDEYSLFEKHLNVFLRHTIASKCSCSCRLKKELEEQFIIVESVKKCFEGGWPSNCRKPIKDGVVSENNFHWKFCDKM